MGLASFVLVATLAGCSTLQQVVGVEDPCDKAERLSKELDVPLDEGASTVGDLEDNLARYGEKAEEAMEAGLECLREQPLPE